MSCLGSFVIFKFDCELKSAISAGYRLQKQGSFFEYDFVLKYSVLQAQIPHKVWIRKHQRKTSKQKYDNLFLPHNWS